MDRFIQLNNDIYIFSLQNLISKQKTNNLKPLTSQDEWQYLQILDHAKNPLPPNATRFKRKLALRRVNNNNKKNYFFIYY